MPGIAVVSNPRSGRNRRSPLLVRNLAAVLDGRGELVEPTDLDALEHAVRGFRTRGVEVVCVNGGDGTLHKVLSALVVVYGEGARGKDLRSVVLPRVAILKGGTLNTMASNLGQRSGGMELLTQVCASLQGGPDLAEVERTLIVVNGCHAGFLFGTGVLFRFMRMYESGTPPSPAKALGLVARVCGSTAVGGDLASRVFALDPATVSLDGKPWLPTAYATIAVGTMNDIGLGFRLFHRASENPGKIHVLGIHGPPMSILRRFHRIPLGRPLDRPDIIDVLGEHLRIDGEAARGFMMDGDFVEGTDTLQVEAGPTVRFVVGARAS
ncbi:MAG: hypothetical protein CL927_11960 [Deltaproteobacteria bacterium]|nr:hypothetical protein [Deltaproteobacteria bacterium]HCH61973.1 hypothetical protein [Deltaproteobacteria bacterium]